ncbi:MAG TPA: hypothetical protein VJT32_17360 [bacterium]|nr:hypothetical protein [bacterium]
MESFTFPPPPNSQTPEWAGTPIGKSNTITRTKTRTAVHDKNLDRVEGRRDELVAAAVEHLVRRAGKDALYLQDVIIHGVRVRAITNSTHLHTLWSLNWYSPEEWQRTTGLTPPRQPEVTVYALGGVSDQAEAAYYSRRTNTIVFFNTAYYGQLKSWVLGAVGRVLAEEWGIHSIHGACVEKDGEGVLYIAPTGTGKSTSSYGLQATYPDTRFHSDDWVYVRYTCAMRDGRRIAPFELVPARGEPIRGYRVFRWLEERRGEVGQVRGLDLDNRETIVPLASIDLAQPIQAYAYTSEKIFYLRTNLVSSFPLSAHEMLRSCLENVPDVLPKFIEDHRAELDALTEAVRRDPGPAGDYFQALDPEQIRTLLARLIAFDNGRAMLDITRILPPDRVIANPMAPTRLGSVILLKRDPREHTVLESLPVEKFIGRLLRGETPDRKKETAYNAYRAVDDETERRFIDRLEAEIAPAGGTVELLYRALVRHQDTPETLAEEVELFRILHRSCRCYDLNTILTADPQVRGLQEAVAATMALIAHAVAVRQGDVHLTIGDYRRALTSPPVSA